MHCASLFRLLTTAACALALSLSVSHAEPLLRYEFSHDGEIQSSTGRDQLDLTVYAGNGVIPQERIISSPAAGNSSRAATALDFRYKEEGREKGAAEADVAQYAALTSELSSFTVTAWIYGNTAHSDGGVRRLFRLFNRSKGIIDIRLGKTGRNANALLSVTLNGESVTCAAPEKSGVFIPDGANEWYFIAVTYSAEENRVTLCAAPEGSTLVFYSETLAHPVELDRNATTLSIGNAGRGHERQIDALLSDVRFYGSALEEDSLAAIYTAAEPSSQASLGGLFLLGGLVPAFLRRRPSLSTALALTLCAGPVGTVVAVEVASQSGGKAIIVMADDASPVVEHAAKELSSSLKQATNADFEVKKESELAGKPDHAIYLGATKSLAETGAEVSKLKKNAFLRLSTESALYLAGNDDPEWSSPTDERLAMGTMMAVYDFLDRDLGVRWLWPGEFGTAVPQHTTLTIEAEPLRVVEPRFLFNRFGYNRMRQRVGDWEKGEEFADRSFTTVHQWLRHHRFMRTLNIETNHAYGKYWSRFGETHREFFALRPDGKRGPVDKREYLTQMCVSNPDLWKVIISDWRQDDPLHPWIAGFENDRRATDSACTCTKCRSWDVLEAKVSVPDNPWHIESRSPEEIDPYESVSLSDRYARFYLELQREGQKHDPFAKVAGFAYSHYSDPPVKTRLNPNIIISVVPPYIYPFGEGKEGQFRELWDGWKATGATLYYRPNHTLVGYCMPYIYSSQLGKDLKHAMDNGMVGSIFDSLLGMWGVHGPDLYLLARLHARPEMTPEAVLDEYYAAFGPAEEAVRQYFAYWEEVSRKCDEAFRAKIKGGWAVVSHGGHLIYTPAVMEKGAALLREAEAKAKDSPEHAGRVGYLSVWFENARLSVELMRMSKIFEADAETHGEKLKRLAARDELRTFRNEHQRYLMGGNWDKVGPYEPWNRWKQ